MYVVTVFATVQTICTIVNRFHNGKEQNIFFKLLFTLSIVISSKDIKRGFYCHDGNTRIYMYSRDAKQFFKCDKCMF